MNKRSLIAAFALALPGPVAYAGATVPDAMDADRSSPPQQLQSVLQSRPYEKPQPLSWLDANQQVQRAGVRQHTMAGSGADHSQHPGMDHSRHQMDHSKHPGMDHSRHPSKASEPKETDNAHSNHH